MNTNAGLWGYSIGDTIKFVSKNPYKIVVTGRIKHFISAFGEHVIAEEVEHAILSVANAENVEKKNIYYFDLIEGKILQKLIIRSLQKDAFVNYMRAEGKLGGQNKVPRLSNDRKMANILEKYIK